MLSRVRDLTYQGKPIDLNQTFRVMTMAYRATGSTTVVGVAAKKHLLQSSGINDYIVSEKTVPWKLGFVLILRIRVSVCLI